MSFLAPQLVKVPRLNTFLLAVCAVPTAALTTDSPAKDPFLAEVEANFAVWDADKSGDLSITELDTLVIDPAKTGAEAAAIGALKRAARGSKRTPAFANLTLERIRTAAATKPEKGEWDLPAMFSFGFKRIGTTNRSLFGDEPGALPQIDTIHQGKLGNCFCLAPLGALVHGRPQVVAQMFQPQPDGAYHVALGKQTIRVAPPTDAELAFIASNESSGLWVNLYEKAVATARNEEKPEAERSASAIEVLARGGSAGTMLAFITGNEIVRFSCKWARDEKTTPTEHDAKLVELRTLLTDTVRDQRLMTCGTLVTTTPGLTPNHAYAILGFDPTTDRLRLWNPHGGSFRPKGEAGPTHGYAMADGIFEIPTADFVKQFSGAAFEQFPTAQTGAGGN